MFEESFGRYWGMIGWHLGVSKSNRLHVDIYRVFLYNFEFLFFTLLYDYQ